MSDPKLWVTIDILKCRKHNKNNFFQELLNNNLVGRYIT